MMAKKQSESQDEITGLRDLSPAQRADIDALCEDGLLPSTIARRIGVPTEVAAAARLAWKRQQDIEQRTADKSPTVNVPPAGAPGTDPIAQVNAMLQQQIQQEILEAQLDKLREDARHRQQMNKLEERERAQDLREREMDFADEAAPAGNNDTRERSRYDYDFDRNPLGAFMEFTDDLKARGSRNIKTAPEANKGPQANDQPDPTKPLSEEMIAAWAARQPPKIIGQAKAAVDSPWQPQLEAQLRKSAPGITDENVTRVLEWLRKTKKAEAGK